MTGERFNLSIDSLILLWMCSIKGRIHRGDTKITKTDHITIQTSKEKWLLWSLRNPDSTEKRCSTPGRIERVDHLLEEMTGECLQTETREKADQEREATWNSDILLISTSSHTSRTQDSTSLRSSALSHCTKERKKSTTTPGDTTTEEKESQNISTLLRTSDTEIILIKSWRKFKRSSQIQNMLLKLFLIEIMLIRSSEKFNKNHSTSSKTSAKELFQTLLMSTKSQGKQRSSKKPPDNTRPWLRN